MFFVSPVSSDYFVSVDDITISSLNLDHFAIKRWSFESSIVCVLSFVPDPMFTMRDFSTHNGIGKLFSAVTAAATVCEELLCKTCTSVLPEGHEAVESNLKRTYNVVVVHHKISRYI